MEIVSFMNVSKSLAEILFTDTWNAAKTYTGNVICGFSGGGDEHKFRQKFSVMWQISLSCLLQ